MNSPSSVDAALDIDSCLRLELDILLQVLSLTAGLEKLYFTKFINAKQSAVFATLK